MALRFAKVSEEEIKTAFFYPSDLVNTKTTIPLWVGEERWIYTSTLHVSVYICCSTIFSFGTNFSELVQNTLNWYNCNCTGLFLLTV